MPAYRYQLGRSARPEHQVDGLIVDEFSVMGTLESDSNEDAYAKAAQMAIVRGVYWVRVSKSKRGWLPVRWLRNNGNRLEWV